MQKLFSLSLAVFLLALTTAACTPTPTTVNSSVGNNGSNAGSK